MPRAVKHLGIDFCVMDRANRNALLTDYLADIESQLASSSPDNASTNDASTNISPKKRQALIQRRKDVSDTIDLYRSPRGANITVAEIIIHLGQRKPRKYIFVYGLLF